MTRVPLFAALALAFAACSTAVDDALSNPQDPASPDTSEPAAPSAPDSQFRTLTEPERAALDVALSDLGVIAPMAGTAHDASSELRTVGPITVSKGLPAPATTTTTTTTPVETYDGSGIQWEVSFGTGDDFLHTGVLAWKGLDVKAQTVDEVILVLVDGLVDAGTVDVGGFGIDEGIAIIWDQVAGETYFADEGTFEITKITFDTEEDCFDTSKAGSGDIECTVSEGTLDGALDVTAEDWLGGGTVERDATFSIPATRVSWSFDVGSSKGGTGKGSGSSSCSASASDGTRTTGMSCEDGDCTCSVDGAEVGTCTDDTCDLTAGCCATFF